MVRCDHRPFYAEIRDPKESYIWVRQEAVRRTPATKFATPFDPAKSAPAGGVQGKLFD